MRTQTIATGLVVAVLVAGCSFVDLPWPRQAAEQAPSCDDGIILPAIDVIVGLAAIGFGGWVAHEDQEDGGDDLATRLIGVPLFVSGAAELGSAVYGFATTSSCRTARRARERERVLHDERAQSRARAWELTKRAAAAARAGDCTVALEVDPHVHDLDPDLYATVFLGDLGIKRCLEPAAR